MMNRLRRLIAGLLVVSLTGMGVPLPAQAGIVATEDVWSNARTSRRGSRPTA